MVVIIQRGHFLRCHIAFKLLGATRLPERGPDASSRLTSSQARPGHLTALTQVSSWNRSSGFRLSPNARNGLRKCVLSKEARPKVASSPAAASSAPGLTARPAHLVAKTLPITPKEPDVREKVPRFNRIVQNRKAGELQRCKRRWNGQPQKSLMRDRERIRCSEAIFQRRRRGGSCRKKNGQNNTVRPVLHGPDASRDDRSTAAVLREIAPTRLEKPAALERAQAAAQTEHVCGRNVMLLPLRCSCELSLLRPHRHIGPGLCTDSPKAVVPCRECELGPDWPWTIVFPDVVVHRASETRSCTVGRSSCSSTSARRQRIRVRRPVRQLYL